MDEDCALFERTVGLEPVHVGRARVAHFEVRAGGADDQPRTFERDTGAVRVVRDRATGKQDVDLEPIDELDFSCITDGDFPIEDMPNGHPGCVVATAAYQDRLFDRDVREANRRAVEEAATAFEEATAIAPNISRTARGSGPK